MAEAPPDTPLVAKLKQLRQGLGLRRPKLAETLGSGLLRLWGIEVEDAPEAVFDTVSRKFEAAIKKFVGRRELTAEDARIIARVSYNLAPYPEIWEMEVENRRKWLNDFNETNWLGVPGAKPHITYGKTRKVEDYYVIPLLEQEFLAEWQARFPDEPFLADSTPNDADQTETEPVGGGSWFRHHRWPLVLATALVLVGASVAAFPTDLYGLLTVSGNTSAANTGGSVAPSSTPHLQGVIPAATPSTASSPPSPPPVRIDSVQYVQSANQGYTYAFPRPLHLTSAELAQANSLNMDFPNFGAWVAKRGGVTSSDAEVQAVVRGNSTRTVEITSLDVVKQCFSPLTGAIMYSPSAGENTDVELLFNLDNTSSIAHSYQTGEDLGPYFGGANAKNITLAPGEVYTLAIHAVTSQHYCQFHFNMTIDTGAGTPITEVINDNGKEFQVTATPNPGAPGAPQYPFSGYQEVYAGGVASPAGDDSFTPVNPATYTGS